MSCRLSQGWSQRRSARELGLDRETFARHPQGLKAEAKPARAPIGSDDAPIGSEPATAPIGRDGLKTDARSDDNGTVLIEDR